MSVEALKKQMIELLARVSRMDDEAASDEIGEFLGQHGGDEVDDPYASDPFDDPVVALRRKLHTRVAHNLVYKYGPLPTPSPEVAAVFERAQEQDRVRVAKSVGLRVGGSGKAMPTGEYKAGRRRVMARAAKRRAARAGQIPKKKSGS